MKKFNDDKKRKIARLICIILVITMILSIILPFLALFQG